MPNEACEYMREMDSIAACTRSSVRRRDKKANQKAKREPFVLDEDELV